ncbi:MAG: serine O-acetyltransferase [Armatimonadota bacterium]
MKSYFRTMSETDYTQQFIEIAHASRPLLSLKHTSEQWVGQVLSALFPELCKSADCEDKVVRERLESISQLTESLSKLVQLPTLRPESLFASLLQIRESLVLDANAILLGDPAATTLDEIILSYPGFLATAHYRLAHFLHLQGFKLVPRIITEKAHRETGIDIHPGAQIGERFFIDHGTGVVIGETTVIGSGVKLYQGVTLGALSISKEMAKSKRHPTIEDDVLIYANATILGGETVIGRGSIIGGNAWITESVAPGSFVKYNPK